MPTHWEPDSWAEFCGAYRGGDCRVVILRRAREWVKERSWKLGWFRFEEKFLERILADEAAYREAYSANVFLIHRRRPKDLRGTILDA